MYTQYTFKHKDVIIISCINKYYYRPKHPIKVHVWAGISKDGATGICIFDGIMTLEFYVMILEQTLEPFLASHPSITKLMQDNDPKHVSGYTQEYFYRENINWWKTPPESPDLNPIENMWLELKEFIWREVKPTTKSDLIEGIKRFWTSVDVAKCNKYINHLN